MKCWGNNQNGQVMIIETFENTATDIMFVQLGDGTFNNQNTPIDVVGLGSGSGVAYVAAGGVSLILFD